MRHLIALLGVMIFYQVCCQGQTNNFLGLFENKIIKADRYYQNQFYSEALDIYKRRLKKDTGSLSLKIKIARCYKALQRYQDASAIYASILKDSSCAAEERLTYAQLLILQGKMDQAKQEYLHYYQTIGDERSAKSLNSMDGLKDFYKDHLCYKVVPMSVNTGYEEFCPVYYSDGFVFISDRMDNPYIRKYTSVDNKYFCKAYYKNYRASGAGSREVKISGISNGNIGPVQFYNDERNMVFSYNPIPPTKKEALKLGLYFAEKDDRGGWNFTYSFIHNNSNYTFTHPTISDNGHVLFFASDMPGGFGGLDIYKCTWNGAQWSEPENAGNMINSKQDDAYPVLWKDSILYFASNGRPGLGGFDIYKSVITGNRYSSSHNVGYPINSPADDFSLTLNPEGTRGMFTSNRNGTIDIYEISKVLITQEILVLDKKSKSQIEGAIITLYDQDAEPYTAISDSNGKCRFTLLPGHSYEVIATLSDHKPIMSELSPVITNKDTIVTDTLIFEKAFQSFVKGVVEVDSSQRIADLKIFIYGLEDGIIDTVITDRKGEFAFEGDYDKDYLFSTSWNDMGGSMYVKGNKEKKSSYLYYLKIQLKSKDKKLLRGRVKTGFVNKEQIVIEGKNEITGQIITIPVNPNGTFTFETFLNEGYVLTAFLENKVSPTIRVIPVKGKQEEVILELE